MNRPMIATPTRRRIVLVTSGFGPTLGGVGVVSAGVVEALAPQAAITVWRHRPDWPSGIRSVALAGRALTGLFRRADFLIFTHVDLARIAVALPFLRNVPYAVIVYGVEVWRPLDRWRRAALERAATIVTISDYAGTRAREFNPWLPAMRVVWLGAAERPTAEARRQTTPTVVMLGRMASRERYKGHDAMIDAWPSVVAAVPGAQLVIVGDGDDRPRLAARAAQFASITFTGFLDDAARDDLLQSAAVLVSISTGEGFGLAAVEAAACGLPVIALKGTVSEELFPEGGHVFLDSADPHSLAEAVVGLLSDRPRAIAIGDAGARRVREVFTTRHFAERLREAISPLEARREACTN